jgi:hypothetical protein
LSFIDESDFFEKTASIVLNIGSYESKVEAYPFNQVAESNEQKYEEDQKQKENDGNPNDLTLLNTLRRRINHFLRQVHKELPKINKWLECSIIC